MNTKEYCKMRTTEIETKLDNGTLTNAFPDADPKKTKIMCRYLYTPIEGTLY